ncbi:MAG: hypothetical protein WAP52_01155 [Candidatus Sungiibacteriota bacterium]
MEQKATKIESILQSQSPPYDVSASLLPAKLEIGTLQAILGVAAILLGIGTAWGTLKTLVKGVKNTLDDEIKPDLKNIRERFMVVEDRVETLWRDEYAPAHSSRQLNTRGQDILKKSGIKEIIDEKKDYLLSLVKDKKTANAYDAESAILSVAAELPKHCPDVIDRLKNGAFRVGADVDGVLFVGGIYLRDLIFPKLGFMLDDLDRPQAST